MKSETNTVKSKAFLSGIDGASAVILETAEYFNNTYKTPIIGQNFSEIVLDDNAYEDFSVFDRMDVVLKKMPKGTTYSYSYYAFI